jgi:transcriptional regulator with GAF, ATPase, and Fis domain
MARDQSVPATVDQIVQLAVESIGSCDAAALKVLHAGVPEVLAATDTHLQEVVQRHLDLRATPMFDAYGDHVAIYVPDVCAERRWPSYTHALSQQLGIHTVYVLPLGIEDKPSGVLALYAQVRDAFDEQERAIAHLLAAHATVALSDAVGRVHFEAALISRTVIAQATGIVMERFQLRPDAAFGVLKRLSQEQNVKLRDIATQIVETGKMP